ncbi:hypothetical protein CDG81_10705 [Actinopolyspora erythraea]|uniref:Uncharacterized protein n=2 Tax=Actinopolyspora erythraea TaxID=414996 RepID=A0A223RS41_9ACTN|nr:hypothetical protein CDG81_10705 [Actinopolyspora erythraea]
MRLSAWTRHAIELVRPAVAPQRTVSEMAAFLREQLDVLVVRQETTRLADETASTASSLRQLRGQERAELVSLGRCTEPGCEATVTLPRRGGDDVVLRGPSCAKGHVLAPRQWLALKGTA